MTRPSHDPGTEALQRVWRRMLVLTLPLMMVGVVLSLTLSANDAWDVNFDRPLYGLVLLVMVFGWVSVVRRKMVQQNMLLLLIAGSALFFIGKMVLLLLFQPDLLRLLEELGETLVWLGPVVTWAMLTELPLVIKRWLYAMLGTLCALSVLMVIKFWQDDQIIANNLLRLLAQFNLGALVTLYGSSYYLLRNDLLGRLQGERDALARLAYTDLLTGLPNRGKLDERLGELTGRGEPFALMFVDVDSFKVANDTLGHAEGDKLLRRISSQLREHAPAPEEVYRLSGDEFVVLLLGADTKGALAVAEEVQRGTLRHSAETGLSTSLSIGVSLFPEDALTPAELLRHADSAMYSVKRAGRAHARRYQKDHEALTERYQQVARALRTAGERGEFHLVYQPIYRLRDMRLVKVEALIRWEHPRLGAVSPAEFIPVAEQNGLIAGIGLWVLEEAAQRAAQWPGLTISVNVSGLQLLRQDLASQVGEILQRFGLPPSALELELTETALLYEDARAIQMVKRLSALGVGLSLDDYGSGYSNMGRLRLLAVSGLKLDQTIVRAMEQPEGREFGRAVTQATVVLAQALGVPLTAEGIENQELLSVMRELGCTLGQGYGLSFPLPAEEISQLYTEQELSAGRGRASDR